MNAVMIAPVEQFLWNISASFLRVPSSRRSLRLLARNLVTASAALSPVSAAEVYQFNVSEFVSLSACFLFGNRP